MLLVLEEYVIGSVYWSSAVKYHPPLKLCNKFPDITIPWLEGGGHTELCTVHIRH